MHSLRVTSVALLAVLGAAVSSLSGPGDHDSHGDPDRTGPGLHGGLVADRPAGESAARRLTGPGAASRASDDSLDVGAENRRPGAPNWRLSRARGTRPGLSGYTGVGSVLPGQPVPVVIRAAGKGPVRIRALRIGWYGGAGAHEVWRAMLPVEADGEDSGPLTLRTEVDTRGWIEGHYLLRLDQAGAGRYLPLTVRSAQTDGRIVVLTSPLTWQAENRSDPTAAPQEPIDVGRPYLRGFGAGGFLVHDAGMVQQAERTGRRLGYATDLDAARRPTLVTEAAAVMTGGDSRYWPAPLRTALRTAADGGTNLIFLGPGTGTRQVQVSPDGRSLRLPRKPADPVGVTGMLVSCPVGVGGAAGAAGAAGAPWVVADADWWGYRGTGVRAGDQLPGLLADGVDRAALTATGRTLSVQVLSSGGVDCDSHPVDQRGVYLVRSSGAATFAVGTGRWACALANACTGADGTPITVARRSRLVVGQVTRSVITAFAEPVAGARYPAGGS